MTTDLPRRRFLVAGAATLVGATAAGFVVVRSADDDEASESSGSTATTAASSTAVSSPVEGVALVGAAYLRDHPDEADEAVLREHLPELTATEGATLLAEFAELRPRVQAEFDADDVVMVDGWILARSEARGAALVSLAP